MSGFQDIKRRLRSIGNTKKITKAMELVAAVKMRRAVERVTQSRPYASRAWGMLTDLAGINQTAPHALLARRALKKLGLVVIGSNRGLCGAFNQNIARQAADYLQEVSRRVQPLEISLILFGKKTSQLPKFYGYSVGAEFTKPDVVNSLSEILPLARFLIDEYKTERLDQVALAYTDYESSLRQKPRIKILLPIGGMDDALGRVDSKSAEPVEDKSIKEFLFEPNPTVVLEELLERLTIVQIYQAVLESDASEHSARMLAMKNATEAAIDMIADLALTYNQARQAAITAELADISGGRIAMES